MKLFFDARFVRFPRHDGVSRYSANLVAALGELTEVTMIIYDKRQLAQLPDLPYVIVNNPISIKELFVARKLNRLGADVVFCPMQLMGSRGRNYKLILTLHDLIYYEYKTPPQNLSLPAKLAWRLFHSAYWPQRFLLDRADFVATVSQTSKKLMQKYRVTTRPIQVIYNAPSSNQQTNQKQVDKKLLYMGSFMHYKNVELLIQALFYLPGYTLHCLSHVSSRDKKELIALAPPGQLIFENGASDEKYQSLLSSAHALVSASKNEGFGLPIIEAMQAGVPVVCSNLAVYREVAGEGALFFETDNPTQFSKQVLKLEDKNIRTELIKKAHSQAEKFSWQKSAKVLLESIERLEKS